MSKSTIYQLKVALEGVKPTVWRRFETKDCTLGKLHAIIQVVMGWQNYHLWGFRIAGTKYEIGEEAVNSPVGLKLGRFVKSGATSFSYQYDFGDDWRHAVTVEEVGEADPNALYPRCLEGARACPPEDCGGPYSYPDLLKALTNPKHPRHKELVVWAGPFDPEAFDLDEVNRKLKGKK